MAMERVDETALAPLRPSEQIDAAKEQANALMGIVKERRLSTKIQGTENEYLHVEAWETLGTFNNLGSSTEYVRDIPVKEANENGFTVYEAKVNLVDTRTGIHVGSGVAICGTDEPVSRGKEGTPQHQAAMSMAQTRATSKAYRAKLAWIAVLGGYAPTPAEEMPSEQPQRPAQRRNPRPAPKAPEPAANPPDRSETIAKLREKISGMDDLTTIQFGEAVRTLNLADGQLKEILGGVGLSGWLEANPEGDELVALEIVLNALTPKDDIPW